MAFQPDSITEFRYLAARLDRTTGEAQFDFALVGASSELFTERVAFTLPTDAADVDWRRVDALVVLLGAVLGLSYYKAAAPPLYTVAVPGLTDAALDYLA
ncbi:MAG TPA: hypothetical protein PL156_10045, partial [Rhodoglobus sp.]|nr:hypothetical protein [Rhodoglobus sp.]